MIIKVEVMPSLKECGATCGQIPEGGKLALNAGGTPANVMDLLTIPAKRVGLILINGQVSPRDTLLKDGDELLILSPILAG